MYWYVSFREAKSSYPCHTFNSSPPRKFPPPIAPRRLVNLAPAAGKHLIGTLQGINISHLGKRKIIFKMPFLGDMLVPWRVLDCFHIFFFGWPCFNIISPSWIGGGKVKFMVKFHFGGFRNTKTCGGMVCWFFHIFQFPLLGALRIWLQLQMVVALLSETPWPSGAPRCRISHGWCLMSWVFWWKIIGLKNVEWHVVDTNHNTH